ncbi:ATP-binding protein [Streptomyces brasiliensis]|uniref:ATP-binding protein n=1 Tax=Streptomyces brasiliensis TaxID=1954 RepID=A0A917K2A4_9ACTN|nr:ATP-binding protein [Streptomyces brasiliensis]GGI94882.1 ATP-binding protein [Streptomyces brasiliensis]
MTPHTTSAQALVTAAPHREYWFGLPALRTSVKAARDIVRDRLCAWEVPGDLCCDAVLLVSELSTNVVIHTRSGHVLCGLTLTGEEHLRIEVHDDDHAPLRPSERRPGPGEESGRGLFLVQQIAERWGSARSTRAQGNVVWAELGAHA